MMVKLTTPLMELVRNVEVDQYKFLREGLELFLQ